MSDEKVEGSVTSSLFGDEEDFEDDDEDEGDQREKTYTDCEDCGNGLEFTSGELLQPDGMNKKRATVCPSCGKRSDKIV